MIISDIHTYKRKRKENVCFLTFNSICCPFLTFEQNNSLSRLKKEEEDEKEEPHYLLLRLNTSCSLFYVIQIKYIYIIYI